MIFDEIFLCLAGDTYDDSHAEMPDTAPVSPCNSEESSSASTADADAPVTGRFGNMKCKYRINPRVLGSGYQGTVRECTDRGTGERFAVKSIRKSDPSVELSELVREIELLREMNHRSIVRLVDVYEGEEHLHIVTDLCRGGELFDKIIEKADSSDGGAPCFEEREAARLLHQILTAVRYMHRHGIVHRDLKPENILFDTDDADSPIKIIDFGLARKHFGNRGEPPMSTVVGTPCYTAPEVIRRKYDKSCDLWSVGVIAYVLLCGYHPFNGATREEVHDSVRRGEYVFPREEWSGASPEALEFIRQLLQPNPRKRMTVMEALNHPLIVKHINSDTMKSAVKAKEVAMVKAVRSEDRTVASRESRGFVRRLIKKGPGKRKAAKQTLNHDLIVPHR